MSRAAFQDQYCSNMESPTPPPFQRDRNHPGTHCLHQAGHELRELPVSVSGLAQVDIF